MSANPAGMAFSLAWGLTIDGAGLRPAAFAAATATLVALALWTASLPLLERGEAAQSPKPS